MTYPAIETKFLAYTGDRDNRVKAYIMDSTFKSGVVAWTNPWDSELNAFENHQKAAQQLANIFFNFYVNHDEPITLVGGGSERGYVWVRV